MKKSESTTLKDNPTTKKKPRAKKLTQIYPEFCTSRNSPYPPILFKRLADDYIEWAQLPDSLILSAFSLSKGMSKDYFKQLCASNDIVKKAHIIAKEFVANRREEMMLYGKLREKPAMHIMYQYNDDWDKADKRWAELRKPEESKSEIKHIILDRLRAED